MQRVNDFIAAQLRRPTGPFGRLVMTRLLDRGNRDLIEATLERLDLPGASSYLDVGFGGGRALERVARLAPEAALWGSDFSADVIAQGQRRLAKLISAGRLNLLLADVGDMPLRDGLVARISTMNTIYFWSDPARAAAELLRVLAPGGRLAIGYTGADKMAQYPHLTPGFTHVRPSDVEGLLHDAGYCDVRTDALHGKVTEGDFVTIAHRAVAT